MDRKVDPLKPSIVDPAAEAAHEHLSWARPSDDEVAALDGGYDEDPVLTAREEETDFVSYVGYGDGSFEVTVSLGRENVSVSQSHRGIGKTKPAIREIFLAAYEDADRALNTLSPQPEVEEV